MESQKHIEELKKLLNSAVKLDEEEFKHVSSYLRESHISLTPSLAYITETIMGMQRAYTPKNGEPDWENIPTVENIAGKLGLKKDTLYSALFHLSNSGVLKRERGVMVGLNNKRRIQWGEVYFIDLWVDA